MKEEPLWIGWPFSPNPNTTATKAETVYDLSGLTKPVCTPKSYYDQNVALQQQELALRQQQAAMNKPVGDFISRLLGGKL